MVRRLALSRWRLVMLAGAMAVTPSACDTTTFLEIEDPDIINPSNVQSSAGANAVRLGALARLNSASSGGESMLLLGGLFTDEWINGDSFIGRQEVDQRVITVQNSFVTDASRNLHRARLSAQQAIELLDEFAPAAPGWQSAEMYFVQAWIENLAAETFCNGVVFSTVIDGVESYGTPMMIAQAFERALAHADSGLTRVTGTTTDDNRVRNALKVVRGRILLNLNRPADAGTSVSGVPNTFTYNMLHSQTTNSNQIWNLNNLAWRYSVGNSEGTNGINFATAADPRLPVCVGGDPVCRTNGVTRTTRDDLTAPLHVQLVWPLRESPVALTSGVEARLIEAEAALRAQNSASALTILNTLRATVTGLAPLVDAGTADARINQLFRERAIWLFGRGYRLGDMRRLIRQYNRTAASVFPVGAWHKGGNYGVDVNFPVPQAEQNNPNVPAGQTCIDRNA
ncbi:MAG TPA: RagB/SusD family nutrient uptake outer membrane protein [Gemmatimonadaceae bacterium]